jgi:hypothetical protein
MYMGEGDREPNIKNAVLKLPWVVPEGDKSVLERPWVVAPEKPTVRYEGFRPEKQVFVQELIERIGIRTDHIEAVVYEPNTNGKENRLASWQRATGKLTFHKLMEVQPAEAQLGTGIHELTHEVSPFDERNESMYGGPEGRKEAIARAWVVAEQTELTGRVINGYHRMLLQELRAGKIGMQVFVEETNAIMAEERLINPKHLKQVSEAQRAWIRRNFGEDLGVDIIVMAEENLLPTMKNVRTVAELDAHVAGVKAWVAEQGGFGPKGVSKKSAKIV